MGAHSDGEVSLKIFLKIFIYSNIISNERLWRHQNVVANIAVVIHHQERQVVTKYNSKKKIPKAKFFSLKPIVSFN